jgi:hypothetical protein
MVVLLPWMQWRRKRLQMFDAPSYACVLSGPVIAMLSSPFVCWPGADAVSCWNMSQLQRLSVVCVPMKCFARNCLISMFSCPSFGFRLRVALVYNV